MAVVIGGTVEEILYWGYAAERIIVLTGNLWLAGVVPVVILAFAHLPGWGWGPALTTVVSGALPMIFYLWQRDLTACIITHVVIDFAGIVMGSRNAGELTARKHRVTHD